MRPIFDCICVDYIGYYRIQFFREVPSRPAVKRVPFGVMLDYGSSGIPWNKTFLNLYPKIKYFYSSPLTLVIAAAFDFELS